METVSNHIVLLHVHQNMLPLILNFRIVLNEQKHCRLTVMPIIQNFKGTFAKLMQKGSNYILFARLKDFK